MIILTNLLDIRSFIMERNIIATEDAPAAIGPYSQAISTPTLVFCSGQLGLVPASGQLVSGGVIAETRQALENLSAVLNAAGSSLHNVLKTTVFMTNLGDFQSMNEVYGSYFRENPPARSTVQVAALPRGACVEIEAIATS
jgi:2-iminobutanoate/2-iminopropanoate deaminase